MKIDDIKIEVHKTVVKYFDEPKRTLFYATFWFDGFYQTYSYPTKKDALREAENKIELLKKQLDENILVDLK